MAQRARRKTVETRRTTATKTAQQRGKDWEKRLRLVGDARFTEVAWSGHDHPSWPLPRK
jgi:hypothetical protein